MKDNGMGGLGVTLLAILALAAVGGLLFTLWLVGPETLRTVLGVLTGALALALVLAASALPIRAWKRRDNEPVVEHHYHDGTTKVIEKHTIDGRQINQPDIKLLQLPAQGSGMAFPELMRSAYRAGLLAEHNPETTQPQEVNFGGQWDGEIEG